mmetsp:Transcript_26216/g.56759  ORF Transcript_26216/g.56759 Transcript_26216/m.56759 type:complete len:458 (-) Transcript_26216:49-1422(-)
MSRNVAASSRIPSDPILVGRVMAEGRVFTLVRSSDSLDEQDHGTSPQQNQHGKRPNWVWLSQDQLDSAPPVSAAAECEGEQAEQIIALNRTKSQLASSPAPVLLHGPGREALIRQVAQKEGEVKAAEEKLAKVEEEFRKFRVRTQTAGVLRQEPKEEDATGGLRKNIEGLRGPQASDELPSPDKDKLSSEVERLRHDNAILSAAVQRLERETESKAAIAASRLQEVEANHAEIMESKDAAHTEEIERLSSQVTEAETKLTSQKQRAQKLLEQQSASLAKMRTRLKQLETQGAMGGDSGNASDGDSDDAKPKPASPTSAEDQFVQLAKLQAERDKAARQNQTQLGQLTKQLEVKEQELSTAVSSLERCRRQLDAVARSDKRGSANIEYLKNIVVKFIQTQEYDPERLVPVIATVLELDEEERKKCTQHLKEKPPVGEQVFKQASTWLSALPAQLQPRR